VLRGATDVAVDSLDLVDADATIADRAIARLECDLARPGALHPRHVKPGPTHEHKVAVADLERLGNARNDTAARESSACGP
jgi:hypothetical protein